MAHLWTSIGKILTRRCLSETFKDFPSSVLTILDVLLAIEPESRGSAASALQSEFFKLEPLPCSPSSLPKYPPSKEFDAKLRDEEARRKKAASGKGHCNKSPGKISEILKLWLHHTPVPSSRTPYGNQTGSQILKSASKITILKKKVVQAFPLSL